MVLTGWNKVFREITTKAKAVVLAKSAINEFFVANPTIKDRFKSLNESVAAAAMEACRSRRHAPRTGMEPAPAELVAETLTGPVHDMGSGWSAAWRSTFQTHTPPAAYSRTGRGRVGWHLYTTCPRVSRFRLTHAPLASQAPSPAIQSGETQLTVAHGVCLVPGCVCSRSGTNAQPMKCTWDRCTDELGPHARCYEGCKALVSQNWLAWTTGPGRLGLPVVAHFYALPGSHILEAAGCLLAGSVCAACKLKALRPQVVPSADEAKRATERSPTCSRAAGTRCSATVRPCP
ncbi:hypothetical protein T492DRAFT_833116 [Pavlovales sp. CCMP2436]|nr:hypothetical protein T492DRAFT_833116 [Pavlovales sp. CCMP2436]